MAQKLDFNPTPHMGITRSPLPQSHGKPPLPFSRVIILVNLPFLIQFITLKC